MALPPLPDLVGWLRTLREQFGCRLLLLVFVSLHLLNGFARNLVGPAGALPYLLRSHAMPAPMVLVFTSVLHSVWVAAPLVALATDLLPVAGYGQAPYVVAASLVGLSGCAVIFAVDGPSTRLLMLCLAAFQVLQVTASVCCTGAYIRKLRGNEEHGSNLQAFVSFGIEAAALAGTATTGLVVEEFNPRVSWGIAAAPAMLVLLLACIGFFGDASASPGEVAASQQRFWRRPEPFWLAVALFSGAFVTNALTIRYASLGVSLVGYIIVAAVVMFAFATMLSPTIARVSVFSIVYNAICINVDSAVFYFLTDGITALPDGPHLSALFYNSTRGPVYGLAALVGIATYTRFMSGWSYRRAIVVSNLCYAASVLSTIVVVRRWNLAVGISDEVFVLMHAALRSATQQWTRMPFRVLFMFLCPAGMETTMYSLLKGTSDLGGAVGDVLGGGLLKALGCQPAGGAGDAAQLERLSTALLVSGLLLVSVVPALLPLVPNAEPNTRIVCGPPQAAFEGSLWSKCSAACDTRMPSDNSGQRLATDGTLAGTYGAAAGSHLLMESGRIRPEFKGGRFHI